MWFQSLKIASLALGLATVTALSCKSADEGAQGTATPTGEGGARQDPGGGGNPKPNPGRDTPTGGAGTGGTPGGAGGMVTSPGSGGAGVGGAVGNKDASGVAADLGAPKGDSGSPVSARDTLPLPPAPPVPAIECKDAKLCDDFEAYDTGVVPAGGWKMTSGKGGTLLVDAKKAYSGTKSIMITTPGLNASAWMSRDKSVFPLANNMMFGRMMTFLSAAPKGAVHWNSIQATGTRPDTKVFAAYQWGAMFEKVMANYWPPDCSKSSKTSWPVAKWACVQWQFDGSPNAAGDGRKNEMRLWVDGVLLNDTTIVRFGTGCVNAVPKDNEWVAPTFTHLQVGWENYQSSPIPIEMWIDDVAVDTARPIACPAPK